MADDFELRLRFDGNVPVVSVSGDVDLLTAPALGALLDSVGDADVAAIIVDLSAVDYIDSTGLGVLAVASTDLREADGELTVVTPSPVVLRLLEVAGLDRAFAIVADLGEAIAATRCGAHDPAGHDTMGLGGVLDDALASALEPYVRLLLDHGAYAIPRAPCTRRRR